MPAQMNSKPATINKVKTTILRAII